jgi:hypothetical protein
MQNSAGLPLLALIGALVLGALTVASVVAGIGGDPALTELQIGATAWAFALAIYGVMGIVSVVVEGRQLVLGTHQARATNLRSAAIAGASSLLFVLAGTTAFAIVAGQPTAVIGAAAGVACLDLSLLLILYKEPLSAVRHTSTPDKTASPGEVGNVGRR